METSDLKKIANALRETIKTTASPKEIVKEAVLKETKKEIEIIKTASQKGYNKEQIAELLKRG